MFPTSRVRIAYDVLKDRRPGRAVRDYLEILRLASQEGESGVDDALRLLLDVGQTPDGEAVTAALSQGRRPAVTDVIIDVDLTMYDRLLQPRRDIARPRRPEGQLTNLLNCTCRRCGRLRELRGGRSRSRRATSVLLG
jgi:hypothetical protein